MDQTTNPAENPSQGPVVGTIIVLVVLLVGAFYFFGRIADLQDADDVATTTADETVGTSDASSTPADETAAIESDLAAEDFSDIESGLTELEAEFAN